jgi:hypothetical protein
MKEIQTFFFFIILCFDPYLKSMFFALLDCSRSNFSVAVAIDRVDAERVVPDGADVGGVVAARVQGERAAADRRRRGRRWNFARAENAQAAAPQSVRPQLPHALPLQLRQTKAARVAGE